MTSVDELIERAKRLVKHSSISQPEHAAIIEELLSELASAREAHYKVELAARAAHEALYVADQKEAIRLLQEYPEVFEDLAAEEDCPYDLSAVVSKKSVAKRPHGKCIFMFDAEGRQIISKIGNKWSRYEYDSHGNNTYYESTDGRWSSYEYGDENFPSTYTRCEDSTGILILQEFDEQGNLTYYEKSIDGEKHIVTGEPRES